MQQVGAEVFKKQSKRVAYDVPVLVVQSAQVSVVDHEQVVYPSCSGRWHLLLVKQVVDLHLLV
jgi:hypothetical protein